jgi:hypothetical protein
LALQNQRAFYGILFRAASETLLQIGADPKHLGARIGFLASYLGTKPSVPSASSLRHSWRWDRRRRFSLD